MSEEMFGPFKIQRSAESQKLMDEIDRVVKSIAETQVRESASLAWLFMKESGLGPSEIEMVQKQYNDGSVSFYFRKLTDTPTVYPPED